MRLVRKEEQEKRILEIPRKENPRIPHDMGRDTNADHVGRGGNSGRGGRGQGGRGRGASATVPRKRKASDQVIRARMVICSGPQ